MEKVRPAKECDRKEIVDCILDAFQKDFSDFIKHMGRDKVQSFLEASLGMDCFYVLEDQGEISAVLALSNNQGRAMRQVRKVAQKSFGGLLGWLVYLANFKDFEINYCRSQEVGFIEFVAVRQKFQGQGLASGLLKQVLADTDYKTYLLDVIDSNQAAIRCYSKLGFSEIKREKVRFAKQKGFKEKIFMEYRKEVNQR